MKILAFGASTSRNSINKKLAIYASTLSKGATVEIIDLNDYQMPMFSEDLEKEQGVPNSARSFLRTISENDVLVISLAEHNGNYTAAFKNILDWSSRIQRDFLQNKPIVLLATSPGPGGANSILTLSRNSFPFFGGKVHGYLSVPSFYKNFDEERSVISNAELNTHLQEMIDSLNCLEGE